MHNNYLMGLKFGTSWRVALTKKKIPYGDLDFLKNGCKSIGSSGRDFLGKCEGFFFLGGGPHTPKAGVGGPIVRKQ